MESVISQKVIDKIRNHEVFIRPRWVFRIVRWGVFTALAAALMVGAISLGLIIELFDELLIHRIILRPGGMQLIFLSLPYIWLIMLAAVLPIAIAEFLRTKNGYRYRLRNVSLVFLAIVLFSGWGFYALGMSDELETFLESRMPFYSSLTKTPGNFWSQPEKGLLSGMVIFDDKNNDSLELEDKNNEIWQVDYHEAKINSRVEMEDGEKIKVLGTKEGARGHQFRADEIRPWTPGHLAKNKPVSNGAAGKEK